MLRIFDKPVREITEHDVQALHAISNKVKQILQQLYNSPSSAKMKIVTRLQAELEARRSDSHFAKLNFSDTFILNKEQVSVRHVVQKGDERVTVRKKVEVEQFLARRARNCSARPSITVTSRS